MSQTPVEVLRKRRGDRARRGVVALAAALATGVVACGSSDEPAGGGDGAAKGGEKLLIANVQPFSGADAAYGPEQDAGCIPATKVINDNGGVLGNTLDCKAVDTRSNPTDAVAAVQKLFATSSNVVGAVGPSSNEVQAIHPMLAQRQVPFFPDTGDPRYNTQESPYYWRIATSDDAGGVALAVTASELGYDNIVIVAGNDSNSQTLLPSLQETFPKLGGTIIETVKVSNGASSYRSEASRVAQSDPDAIVFPTTAPQTVATFLGEFKQLHDMVPVLGQVPPLQPKFSKAIAGAIGRDVYEKQYYSVHQFAPTSGPAYEVFKTALLASGDRVDDPSQWAEDPFSLGPFDAVTIMALAMLHAKSAEPTKFNASIMEVTKPGDGKTVVNTFAEGKKALAAGEQIQYVGALGTIAFTASHNSTGGFIVTQAKGKKESKVIEVTPDELADAVG